MLAALFVLVVGLYTFDKNLSYSLSFSSGFVIAGLLTLAHIHRYGFPSWRAGIPLYYMLMFFVLPLYQQLSGFIDFLSIDSAPKAWLLGAAGLLAFSATVNVLEAQSNHSERLRPRMEDRWPLNRLTEFPAAALLAVVGTAATYWSVNYGYYGLQIVEADRYSTLAGVISSLTLFVDAVTVIAWVGVLEPKALASQNRKGWIVLAVAITAVSLYFALYSNSKAALVKPFFVVVLAYFAVRRKFSILVIASVILGYVLVVYPFITTFRIQYDLQGLTGRELFAQSVYHLKSLDWLYGHHSVASGPGDSEAFGSLGRGLFVTFSTIVGIVDGGSTLKGDTFVAALMFLVPRVLWPSKPDGTVGNLIGHFTGMILPGDMVTNVSPTQMGEFYMNFGFIGLLVGMVIWGAIAHAVDGVICRRIGGWMATFMFFWSLLQEAAFGQGILSVVKAVPVYLAGAAVAAVFADVVSGARRIEHAR